MTLILIVYLLLVVSPIGMVIHEFGHAFGAKLVKSVDITITFGIGKKIFTFVTKHTRINIHALYFLGGYTKTSGCKINTNKHVFWITLLGPLNNALFAIIFYYLNQIFVSPYLNLLFLFNLWLAVVNILPFKYKGKQSDGYIILQSLQNKN